MAISNNSTGLRPGVCTSSTRPTAPYEGQQIYETDTDLTYIWGGSAWQQVSGGTAVGNSGLVYITSSTIGSGVSSATVSNCFSSTYDNYRVVVTGTVASNNADWTFQLTGITGSVYSNQGFYQLIAVAAINTYANTVTYTPFGTGTTTGGCLNILELSSPYLSAYKYATFSSVTDLIGVSQTSRIASTSSATGFTIGKTSGTLTGGIITVYGYRK